MKLAMKEAYLYEQLSDNKVQCHVCARRCVIPSQAYGFCFVRKNVDGRLYALNYSKLCAINVDPIGKKPLMHFNPGSSVLSIATVSCNFRCRYCDNWAISQEREIIGRNVPPEKIVEMAKENECQGITYTYTEPTIFVEICHDAGRLAYENGLFNTWVTNGYATPETIRFMAEAHALQAATVDFKGGGNPEFYKRLAAVPSVEPIYECLRSMKKQGIYVEVTNLVVPKYGDSLDDIANLARWIKDNLGRETVFHLLRFHPDYELIDVPSTPIETLEKAREVAMEYLDYVLLGNVPGHSGEHTYCPSCKQAVIERFSFSVIKWNLTQDNRCMNCGYKIPIQGRYYPGGLSYPRTIL
ncbi:MAG: AmmeMemoRadiSam system radical SAM enzyme [Candidatus Nezhaarchaeales archaeon]